MEYNSRLLLHAPNIFKGDPRPLGDDIYAPCSSLPKKFLASCYFAEPDWWAGVLHRDYKKIGDLCAAISDAEYKTQCFLGVGKGIVWFQPKLTDRAVRICDTMPKKEYSLLCRSQAAMVVHMRTGDESLAAKICEGLDAKDKSICLEMPGMSGMRTQPNN